MMKDRFLNALYHHSMDEMQTVSKSDLHSHAGRGGNIKYIEQWKNVKIVPPSAPFNSLDEMQSWFVDHIKCYCPAMNGYLKRIEASFVQAKEDHISILCMNFGIDELDSLGMMPDYIKIMNELHDSFSPDTRFFPRLSIGRESNIDDVLHRLDEILSCQWFASVDLCNDEFAQPIKNFKPIYRRAKKGGLRLTAHVGEFGSADDVMEAVEELELDEVQHGIAAAQSPQIMRWLADHKIQLNICPTSNVMLKTAKSYAAHPIRTLYDYAIPVTINTDDLLIFNSSVSQEYFHLFHSNCMTAEELNTIREIGLNQSLE